MPKTIFTSCAARAREFVAATGPCVTKSLAYVVPRIDGRPRWFVTRRVGPDHDFNGLFVAPAIFQQAITAAYSLRANVVGEQVFVSRIDVDGPLEGFDGVTDWRLDQLKGNVRFAPYRELPDSDAQRCVRLVQRLGLLFGAMDLLVDAEGRLWFLEVNPNGQWAFLDEETTLATGRALAHLLEGAAEQGR